MKTYNPEQAVDPVEWRDLDEDERYHRKKRIKMPNVRLHAAIHVVVENQVALGAEIPAEKTLNRLMQEGLSRHDAIHAIGTILAEQIFNLVKHGAGDQDVNADYYDRLEKLTADGWLKSGNK